MTNPITADLGRTEHTVEARIDFASYERDLFDSCRGIFGLDVSAVTGELVAPTTSAMLGAPMIDVAQQLADIASPTKAQLIEKCLVEVQVGLIAMFRLRRHVVEVANADLLIPSLTEFSDLQRVIHEVRS